MSKFTEAADLLKRRAKEAQALIDAAAALDEIGSIDNYVKEATQRKEAAIVERDAAIAEAQKAKAAIVTYKEQAKDIVAKANDQALAKLGEADQKAQSILDGAAAKANEMVSVAVSSVEDQKAVIAGQVAQLTSKKVMLEQDVAALNLTIAKLVEDANEADAKLKKIQAAIAKYAGV